jgi:ABC-type nitrate/sulfonate/bicarbonate transport system permease component
MAADVVKTGLLHSTGERVKVRARRWALPLVPAVVGLVAWELLSRWDTSYFQRRDVPPPVDIAQAFWLEVRNPLFLDSIEATMKGWAAGLFLATLFAIPLGIGIGSSRIAFLSTRAVIDMMRAIPGIVLLPLLVLLIGVEFNLKLTLVAMASFWPLLIQTLYGVQDVDPVARDMARAYGLGRIAIFFRVTLPSSVPYIVTGFRLSAVLALNVAIGVELLIGGGGGIGDRMNKLGLVDRVPDVYVYVVVSAIIGLIITLAVRRLERYILYWHASQRETVPL